MSDPTSNFTNAIPLLRCRSRQASPISAPGSASWMSIRLRLPLRNCPLIPAEHRIHRLQAILPGQVSVLLRHSKCIEDIHSITPGVIIIDGLHTIVVMNRTAPLLHIVAAAIAVQCDQQVTLGVCGNRVDAGDELDELGGVAIHDRDLEAVLEVPHWACFVADLVAYEQKGWLHDLGGNVGALGARLDEHIFVDAIAQFWRKAEEAWGLL